MIAEQALQYAASDLRFRMETVNFVCAEPKRTVIREVRPMELADVSRVYECLSNSLEARGRSLPPEFAAQEFANPEKLLWCVDHVGLLIANTAGDVHVFFWDGRLRGREWLCRQMGEHVMDLLGRDDIFTDIPITERAVIKFAQRVGFVEEKIEAGLVTLRLHREARHGR